MKKGFTLIELLAVIVILAIIALIATPIILNIIGNAKSESNERTKELYLDAVKDAIARKNLTEEFNPSECTVKEDGNLLCGDENLLVEVSGIKPCSGTITFDKKGKITNETVTYCNGDSSEGTDEPVVPSGPSFANDDWATIIANVKAGNTDIYNVGDEKEITLTGFGTFTVRIANKSNNPEDGCGTVGFSETACGFVIEFKDIITKQGMNSDNTNAGGWNDSFMRKYVNTIDGYKTIFTSLPQEIQAAIIDTKVISGHGSTNGLNYEMTNKLYLLSSHEVYGPGSSSILESWDSAWGSTRQLDYYKNEGVTTDSETCAPAIKNYNGTATNWWLRSALSSSDCNFIYAGTSGDWGSIRAYNSYGVAPAFRLG